MAGSWDRIHDLGSQSDDSFQHKRQYIEPVYEAFLCPLSKQILKDLISMANGQTFEREAIENWFNECKENGRNLVCPVTLRELKTMDMTPAIALRKTVEEWNARNEAARLNLARKSLTPSSSESDVLQALRFIQQLATENLSNKHTIRHAKLIPMIIDILNLKTTSRKVRFRALETLRIVVEDDNDNKAYRHTQIQLETVVSATNKFADKNIIREGGYGKDYRGQMLQFQRFGQLIDITAQRLNHTYGQGDVEFWKEISTLYSLKHKNVASIIGFCDEKDEKIIIYAHPVHGTLDQHLSNPDLTWFQRLQICLGVARALSYIHFDVIHCDIKSSKIFLDKDWEPKIFGFQLSTKYPQSWRHRLLFPQNFDTNNMTPKHDVYSFGVLLFEVLCGGNQ